MPPGGGAAGLEQGGDQEVAQDGPRAVVPLRRVQRLGHGHALAPSLRVVGGRPDQHGVLGGGGAERGPEGPPQGEPDPEELDGVGDRGRVLSHRDAPGGNGRRAGSPRRRTGARTPRPGHHPRRPATRRRRRGPGPEGRGSPGGPTPPGAAPSRRAGGGGALPGPDPAAPPPPPLPSREA